MKTMLLLTVAALSFGCKKSELDAARQGDTAATRYVQDLQNDVKKAQTAANAANAAIQKTNQGVDEATKAAE